MSLFVSSLNSGSNGNCYYIGNEKEAVLVDVGISCREIERRMKRLDLSMQKIKAVFISHEHTDHIRGLHSLVKKYSLPVYITTPTLKFGRLYFQTDVTRNFTPHETIAVGDLKITAFPKLHDASDPYSFTISYNDTRVGVFTDIGLPCENLINHFKQCHAAFLEANYDDEMLDKGNYPFHLKRRIKGGKGHLSNKQALDLFKRHRPSFMTHLILSHLSQNNNCPKLVEELFTQHAEGVKMIVASRHEETAVYAITSTSNPLIHHHSVQPAQMELFV
ncbi:MAG TPA: MBL fold metallo-hydrolase [Flavisolibacter sp.]|nr:MBL fold metallo-hydrolase [Flavisolibacter sp.]